MTRLVVFGGSFDPVHRGHLFIAAHAVRTLGAERVLFLPSRDPRHRGPLDAAVADRCAMLRGAIAPYPAFALDLTDAQDDATGFTVDCIPRLRARYPDRALVFLAGMDSLAGRPWHRFADVVGGLDGFAVAARAHVDDGAFSRVRAGLPEALRDRIVRLDQPLHDASATQTRRRIAAGESVGDTLPLFVERYIAERGLYQVRTG